MYSSSYCGQALELFLPPMLAYDSNMPAWLEGVDKDRVILDELVDMIFPMSILDTPVSLEQYMSTTTILSGLSNSKK